VTFYLAVPIWAAAVRRARGGELVPLALVAVGGAVVQCASADRRIAYPFGVSLLARCTWMAIGMALAVASVTIERDPRRLARLQALAELPELCWALAAACFAGLMRWSRPADCSADRRRRSRQSVGSTLPKLALEVVLVACLLAPVALGQGRRGWPGALLGSAPLAYLG